MEDKATPQERLIFFDNLRYLLILFVIVEHSANAYNGLSWWPVDDPGNNLLAGGLSALSDALAMPLLFFIAGYFAPPNLRKKGLGGFLKGKLRRLGLPWLVCILTICPVLSLIYHYTRQGFSLTRSYWSLWLELLGNALEFKVGVITSLDQLMRNNQFYQRYMWFLSLLLLFFFLFALAYASRRRWFEAEGKVWAPRPATVKSTLGLLAALGLSTTLLSFPVVGLMLALTPNLSNPEPYFSLGNVIQFRPSRFFFFLIYFGLGVLTYRNKWLERGVFPGRPKTWVTLSALLLAAYLLAFAGMRTAPPELEELFGPVFFLVLNFFCAACLGLFTSLGLKYWNRPREMDRRLAANSYSMYLSHYIFVITAQLILLPISAIPGTLKFASVAVSSGILAYLSSQWLVRPHPRLAAAAAFGLLAVMVLAVHP